MKLIFFHDFGSSSQCGVIKKIRGLLPDFEIVAPDIPIDPIDALPFLKQLCAKEQPDVVIGAGIGGMYAHQMTGFKRICVNPTLMSSENKALKVGTFVYFDPRVDGETHFTITPGIIANYVHIEEHQFDNISKEHEVLVFGLFGSEDEDRKCCERFQCHYKNYILFYGCHSLSFTSICAHLIPLIRQITDTGTPQNRYALLKAEIRATASNETSFIGFNSKLIFQGYPTRSQETCKHVSSGISCFSSTLWFPCIFSGRTGQSC